MTLNPNTILDEISSDQVQLVCGRHNYVASRRRANATLAIPPETRGCAQCWKVYYITDLALTEPSKRKERLDELEEVIHHAIEYERKGQFGKDFELFDTKDERFRVEIERDANDTEETQKLDSNKSN